MRRHSRVPSRWSDITAAVALALTATAALAQDKPAATDARSDKVVITGSNIRRTSAETPSPVQTLTADDLKQSGYTSISDVLHGITANNMGSLTQANASAFAAGGGGVSLRGLTVGATLVLINGHRMAPYPMPDDGERDFVDLSSIPFDAVERIEILKDGASAVYGSDAMAGVVNVILKKSYVGTRVTAEAGTSSKRDGNSVHVALTHGYGNLDTDGFNAYGSLEYRHQDAILLSRRPYLSITDWTPYGGVDLSSGGSPYYQLQPQTQSLNGLVRVTKRLNADWQANVQASVFNSQATQVGVFNAYGLDATGTQLSISTLQWGPATYNNPVVGSVNIPVPASVVSAGGLTLTDVGPQTQKADTTSYRLVAELNGSVGDWDVDASLGWTRARTQLRETNFISASGLAAAVAKGSYPIPAAPPANPYQPLPGVTAATYGSIAPPASATSQSDLSFASLHASRDTVNLPGGPLSLGLGVDLVHKSLDEQFPASFASGDQSSPIYSFAVGSQQIAAAYAEIVAPLLKSLELDAAVRTDHYNTYGSSTTPKIGFKYMPAKALTLRGTYAKGFRAPNAAERGVSGSTSGVLAQVADPLTGAPVQFPQLQLSNPDLKPEKSTSYTLGVIFEPNQVMNFSLDYYDITISNQITSPGLLGSIQVAGAYDPLNPATSPNNPYLAQIYRDSAGNILYETYKFVNGNKTHTNGIDLDLRLAFRLGEGERLSTELNFTRMFRYDVTYFGSTYAMAGTHGPGFVSGDTGSPRDRMALTTTYRRGPMELTGTLNYVSGISVLDTSYGIPDCNTALSYTFPNGVGPAAQGFCQVPSFTTFNLAARYALTPKLSLQGSIVNLFDRHAPYDLQTFGSAGNGAQNGGAPYNPALHQDGAIGRYFNIGATYTF
ncbi:MAG: TonB-dependent receptor [Burkholderiales bacterium]|nr:TonB-dependent receptor [Burkholderiales bacterium]